MTRPRLSIARVMAAVAIVAGDFALLRTGVFDPALVLTIPVLEWGLFRVRSSRGHIRPYWLGFEAFGWAGVFAHRLGLRILWFRVVGSGIFMAIHLVAPRWPRAARALGTTAFGNETIPFGVVAILAGLPIWALAWFGGALAARLAARRADSTSRSVGPEAPALRA